MPKNRATLQKRKNVEQSVSHFDGIAFCFFV